jgi:aspartate/methionine/tyrosine aminotransferase
VDDGGRWIAQRMAQIEASGIRKAFDMGKSMVDPIDLSIGLPDFDLPEAAKAAAVEAIASGFNAYTVTQGLPELRSKILERVNRELPGQDRDLMITSGTGGALTLSLCATIDPGDEVIVFDPYFVMYGNLVALAGGKAVLVETYPDFQIDPEKVEAAMTPRTKAVILNSPSNPTGAVATADAIRGLAELCRRRGVLLISDEVYRSFSYTSEFVGPAKFWEDVLVVDGFSKAYGMTGWRLGFAHGPRRVIQEMAKLQQFTFVCAPSVSQKAGIAAWDQPVDEQVAAYRRKRDEVVAALQGLYEIATPEGAFYAFPRAPWGTATEFVAAAIRQNLLIIPGNVFSRRDTHFRLSYAVSDATLGRGLAVLRRLAENPES